MYGDRHKLTRWMALQMLGLVADFAVLDIFTYLSRHAMPPVHPVHVVSCPVIACIARVVAIVQLLQHGALWVREF